MANQAETYSVYIYWQQREDDERKHTKRRVYILSFCQCPALTCTELRYGSSVIWGKWISQSICVFCMLVWGNNFCFTKYLNSLYGQTTEFLNVKIVCRLIYGATVFEGLKWLSVGCMKLDERKYDEVEFGEVPLYENKKAIQFRRFIFIILVIIECELLTVSISRVWMFCCCRPAPAHFQAA
jgi:hypothetical protein